MKNASDEIKLFRQQRNISICMKTFKIWNTNTFSLICQYKIDPILIAKNGTYNYISFHSGYIHSE